MQPFESNRFEGLFLLGMRRGRHTKESKKEVNQLRKGTIICVVGEAPDKWSEDGEASFREQISKFQAVRIITPQISSFQMLTYWLQLLSNGITDIVIAMAEFNDNGKLEFTEKSYKLPLIGMS